VDVKSASAQDGLQTRRALGVGSKRCHGGWQRPTAGHSTKERGGHALGKENGSEKRRSLQKGEKKAESQKKVKGRGGKDPERWWSPGAVLT